MGLAHPVQDPVDDNGGDHLVAGHCVDQPVGPVDVAPQHLQRPADPDRRGDRQPARRRLLGQVRGAVEPAGQRDLPRSTPAW